MKAIQKYLQWALLSLAVGAIVACTIVSFLAPPMYDDYLIFQYGGWRVSEGTRLFADVWDHKSPFIFWMSALGFCLTPNSLVGINLVTMIMWIVTLVCSYKGLVCFFPNKIAAFITTLVVLGGVAYGAGCAFSGTALQTVEGLTLMFWSVGFCIWAKTKDRDSRWWLPTLLGMVVASGAMCKVNLMGFGLFLISIWTWSAIEKKSWYYFIKQGFWAFIGFCVVIGGVVLVFATSGTISDLYDAAWGFSFYEYRGHITFSTLACLAYAWCSPIRFPFYLAWVVSTGIGMIFVLTKSTICQWKIPVAIGIWFVTETILTLLAGRFVFEHYLIIGYLPLFTLLAFIISCQRLTLRMRCVAVLAGFLLMLAFGARIVEGLFYKMSWAERQTVALTVPEIVGRPVAVIGFIQTAKVMLANQAFTPQKYFCHYGIGNAERQKRMEKDLYETLTNTNTAAFIVEGTMNGFLEKSKPNSELQSAIQLYEYNRTLELPRSSVELWLPKKK